MRGSDITKGTVRDKDSNMTGVDQVTIILTATLIEITIEGILIIQRDSIVIRVPDRITVVTITTITTGEI